MSREAFAKIRPLGWISHFPSFRETEPKPVVGTQPKPVALNSRREKIRSAAAAEARWGHVASGASRSPVVVSAGLAKDGRRDWPFGSSAWRALATRRAVGRRACGLRGRCERTSRNGSARVAPPAVPVGNGQPDHRDGSRPAGPSGGFPGGRRAEAARKVRGRHRGQNQGKGKTSPTRAESWPASPRRRGRPGSGGAPPRCCPAGTAPGRPASPASSCRPGPAAAGNTENLTTTGHMV